MRPAVYALIAGAVFAPINPNFAGPANSLAGPTATSYAELRARFPSDSALAKLSRKSPPQFHTRDVGHALSFFLGGGIATVPKHESDRALGAIERSYNLSTPHRRFSAQPLVTEAGTRHPLSDRAAVVLNASWGRSNFKRVFTGIDFVASQGPGWRLWLGAGIARQWIKLSQGYNEQLSETSALRRITLNSGVVLGGYVSAGVTGFSKYRASRVGIAANCRYFFSPDASFDYDNTQLRYLRMQMHGLLVSIGPVIIL